MKKDIKYYEIAASMCGLQSGNSTFEGLKHTSHLFVAIFWFVIFIIKYPMVHISYGKNIPECANCPTNENCKYKVEGI